MENLAQRSANFVENAAKTIRVVETFHTIQGEGALIGRPTVFVRTGGCDYQHCSWCDTLYAVLPEYKSEWTPMTPDAIMARVLELSGGHPILVTLSGGNPALQPLDELLNLGHAQGCTFAMETQGSVAREWFAHLDYLVLSPKPPSSGMAMNWEKLHECVMVSGGVAARGPQVSLKVVAFDEADYAFARRVHARFPQLAFYLQPGNATPDRNDGAAFDASAVTQKIEWLIARTAQDGWTNVTILPQLHTLLWANARGV